VERTLVLPFAARGDAEPAWLSAGIAAFVAEGLALADASVVSRDERAAALDEAGLADEPRLMLATACRLAAQLGAGRVVTGTWTSEGSRFDVTARLIDVRSMRLLRQAASSAHLSGFGPSLATLVTALSGDDPGASVGRPALEALAGSPSLALMAWMQAAGEPDVAARHLEAALQASPSFVQALLDLAEVHLDEGRPELAAQLVGRVPAAAAAAAQRRAQVLEARVALAEGEAVRAVTLLVGVASARPDREPLLWLAEAQLLAGQREAAAATARRILAQVPEDAEAQELLERAAAPHGASGEAPRSL
jgi:tetratricopeptide (TPR) repeat protein